MPDLKTIPAQDYQALKAEGYTDAEIQAAPSPNEVQQHSLLGTAALSPIIPLCLAASS
jgi:hypothetical protein